MTRYKGYPVTGKISNNDYNQIISRYNKEIDGCIYAVYQCFVDGVIIDYPLFEVGNGYTGAYKKDDSYNSSSRKDGENWHSVTNSMLITIDKAKYNQKNSKSHVNVCLKSVRFGEKYMGLSTDKESALVYDEESKYHLWDIQLKDREGNLSMVLTNSCDVEEYPLNIYLDKYTIYYGWDELSPIIKEVSDKFKDVYQSIKNGKLCDKKYRLDYDDVVKFDIFENFYWGAYSNDRYITKRYNSDNSFNPSHCSSNDEHKGYRIIALKDFGDVKAGDKGGYISGEHNLSHDGECWVYEKGRALYKGRVQDNAKVKSGIVCDHGRAKDNALITGGSMILGKGLAYDNAILQKNSIISGSGQVGNNVILDYYSLVSGNAKLTQNGMVLKRDSIVHSKEELEAIEKEKQCCYYGGGLSGAGFASFAKQKGQVWGDNIEAALSRVESAEVMLRHGGIMSEYDRREYFDAERELSLAQKGSFK